MRFKDYFSKQASDYHHYRPHYPPELFEYLASLVSRHDTAWDCATGNGQAAHGLAPYFQHVIATDASEKQLAHAIPHEKITYRIAPAEKTNILSESVDLVTVAQAMHWLDFEKFYAEVRRVLRPGGVIAIWMYNLLRVSADIDAIVNQFYTDIVGAFWPPERKLVKENYKTIPFPFDEIPAPKFEMHTLRTLDHLLGYFNTWSAVQRYIAKHSADPVDKIQEEMLKAWGEREVARKITWPLFVQVGRVSHS